ncbi:MAG: hypothetical protein CME17_06425 [Gemmatimonadetes bacterium]|nr:hypothetical protein [Gemmatimonadota bacterium]
MYRRANQSFLMDPVAALKLLKLWVWIPPEILQSSVTVNGRRHNLKELSEARFKYRKEFWIPVMQNFNLGTAEANQKLAQELCLNLFLRTLPLLRKNSFGNSELRSGLTFDTNWYRRNKAMAFQFFQTLQTRKIERMDTEWEWHECAIGGRRIKIFEIETMAIPVAPDEYTPELLSTTPAGDIVDEQTGFCVDMGMTENPF